MAFISSTDLPFHAGELRMHHLLLPSLPPSSHSNPTSPFLTPGAARFLARAPLLAVGALDRLARPWTSLWSGPRPDGTGIARPLGQSMVDVRVPVSDPDLDPVLDALLGSPHPNPSRDLAGTGEPRSMVSGLTIDLETRSRIKLYGRMVAGGLSVSDEDRGKHRIEAQLRVHIEQSLGNCPKYINIKHLSPTTSSRPTLLSDALPLPQRALDLIAKADLFFLSSSNEDRDMDTNIRGGPPGFVRVVSNTNDGETVLAYPEYSGNRLYQTLGNLASTPRAGLVFPDFDTGDVLYLTGTTDILVGPAAADLLPRSNLAVVIHVTAARFVAEGLSFRGKAGEPSPYTPPVRYLRTEGAIALNAGRGQGLCASLVQQEKLTPNVFRARFRIRSSQEQSTVGPITWQAGQYVALSFEDELSTGYSHMRDDDPGSLNDDYIRTFTVSSAPAVVTSIAGASRGREDEFEITYRALGKATKFLSRQPVRGGLELPIRGFEGTFSLVGPSSTTLIPFVAAGVGITPLLAHLPLLDRSDRLQQLRLFWTIKDEDIGLILDTLDRCPSLARVARIFVTGPPSGHSRAAREAEMLEQRVQVVFRRMTRDDLFAGIDRNDGELLKRVKTWYMCAGPQFRATVKQWLEPDGNHKPEDTRRELIAENFDY